jgi:hypothetical protein
MSSLLPVLIIFLMQGHTQAYDASAMYNKPPFLLICMLAASALCCILVLVLTWAAIKQQVQAAKAYGFGGQALMQSYGPRTDRAISLMMVHPVFAFTAALQMFLPDLALLVQLLRTCYFAYAAKGFIELSVLLAGGQKELLSNLPSEPIAVWGAPPLCCLFGWPCCKRKINSWYLQVYILGMRQFICIVPLVSAFELYYATIANKKSEDMAFVIIFILSSLVGLWSTKSLMGPVAEAITTSGVATMVSHRGHAFLFQMFLTKLPDKILEQVIPRVMKSDWQSNEWSMPPGILAIILEGLIVSFGTLALSVYAYRTTKDITYPSSDPESLVYQRDSKAILELNGIVLENANQKEANVPSVPFAEANTEVTDL